MITISPTGYPTPANAGSSVGPRKKNAVNSLECGLTASSVATPANPSPVTGAFITCDTPVQIEVGVSKHSNALLNARSIMEPLIKQLNDIHTKNRSPYKSRQDYELLVMKDFPYPFAVLYCPEDGDCGYHSVVRHSYPHLDIELDMYLEQVYSLKQCSKMFNIETFTPEMEYNLKQDYPFLKEGGLSVKDNYADNFKSCFLL